MVVCIVIVYNLLWLCVSCLLLMVVSCIVVVCIMVECNVLWFCVSWLWEMYFGCVFYARSEAYYGPKNRKS